MRILVVDNQELVRAGIRALIDRLPGATAVGEAADGLEALLKIADCKPNLVLMEIVMPRLNGIEATAMLSQRFPDTRVMILSMYAREEYVREAIEAGAAGYLLKRDAVVEFERAILAIGRGTVYLSPLIAGFLEPDGTNGICTIRRARLDRLTPRQRQILRMISERHSTRDIATMLNISIKTVETHRAQLMERLGIYDVPGLVRFAICAGLVSLEE